MTTTIATVTQNLTIQSYTLAAGDEINVTTLNATGNRGDAIYTTYSPQNATTIGGATIVIDATGIVYDGSSSSNTDEYAIQTRGAADATLDNFGLISATSLVAVGINDGKVINELHSTIVGQTGVRIGSGTLASTIINIGTITGLTNSGIDFLTPGTVVGTIINEATGVIRGGTSGGSINETGIYIGTGTVENAGTISQGASGGYSLEFFNTAGNDRLILDPGQVLNGIASASGSGNFIVLGSLTATTGDLANPANYHGFSLLSLAAGADWKIGTSTGAVTLTGMPSISIGQGAELIVEGTIDSSISGVVSPTAINFNGNGEHSTLDLSGTDITSTRDIPNPIVNFGATDTIILGPANFTETPGDSISYGYTNGVLTILDTTQVLGGGTNSVAHIDIAPPSGTLNTANFRVALTPNGVIITDNPCFAAGTRILTPTGEVAVEDLEVGDEVLTAREGFESVAPIIWVGQRTIDLARHAMPEKVRPIRILAGAFGPGLPERDLVLSPDHALFIDGYLIEAKTLVNGVTVIVDKNIRHVTYHHIEMARHDVVLAEGLPAETYLESGNRMMFESNAAPMALHPDFVSLRRERACARLLVDGPVVVQARQRLLDRALALGFAVTGDVDLVVKAGLERIRPTETADGDLLFVLPAGAREAQLLSGTGVPAEISADPGDRRVLGVAVAGLALIAGGERHSIPLDDAAHEGFHDFEAGHRWTKGAARIALPAYSGRAVLEVAIHGQAARWSSVNTRQLSG
jgi:hypothetical protein